MVKAKVEYQEKKPNAHPYLKSGVKAISRKERYM